MNNNSQFFLSKTPYIIGITLFAFLLLLTAIALVFVLNDNLILSYFDTQILKLIDNQLPPAWQKGGEIQILMGEDIWGRNIFLTACLALKNNFFFIFFTLIICFMINIYFTYAIFKYLSKSLFLTKLLHMLSGVPVVVLFFLLALVVKQSYFGAFIVIFSSAFFSLSVQLLNEFNIQKQEIYMNHFFKQNYSFYKELNLIFLPCLLEKIIILFIRYLSIYISIVICFGFMEINIFHGYEWGQLLKQSLSYPKKNIWLTIMVLFFFFLCRALLFLLAEGLKFNIKQKYN